ncbi:PIN domain-containing protein [Rhodopseudomonas palustris]|uniref:PIN domain-containing protein n=1 Tax=Rhodopseudomonas palustris (strain BisB18) TaxID=316056 RepID=Q218X4_RHOPB
MLIVVPDVNVLVSRANADRAGRSSTISQKVVQQLVSGVLNGEPVQLAMSFKMLDTYRDVLLRKGYDREAVEQSADGLIALMRYGPIGFDPYLVLGGTPELSVMDVEDGGVLATAYAAHANLLVTDNLKDFAGHDAEAYVTSVARSADGTRRDLYCVIRKRPDGHSLIVVHPADFVRWMESGFKMSADAIKASCGAKPQA